MSDELELEPFYRRTYGLVFEKALRLLRNDPDAREVTQEVYLRAHESWPKVRTHPSPIGWLITVTTRLAIDRLRRAQVSRRESPKLAGEEVNDPRGRLEASRLLEVLLREEGELTQIIVCHVLLEGMSQEEAALVLEISRKTVQRHLGRFQEKCARLLPELGEVLRHA